MLDDYDKLRQQLKARLHGRFPILEKVAPISLDELTRVVLDFVAFLVRREQDALREFYSKQFRADKQVAVRNERERWLRQLREVKAS